MRGKWLIAGVTVATGAVAQERVKPADWPGKPPVAAVRPVTETLHGTTLVDPYRYMETADAETIGWIKAQGSHTRSVLDAIPARADYAAKLAALSGSFGYVLDYREAGGRSFYQERPAGGDVYDLMVRDAAGPPRKLVDVAGLIARTGKPHAINYYEPSPDGRLVAIGISAGGNENADLTVVDVASGRTVAGPLPYARFAGPSFTPDGKLALTLSQVLKPGEARTGTFLNRRSVIWDMKGTPVDVVGAPVAAAAVKLRPDEAPYVGFERGSRWAALIVSEGVRNEADFYLADAAAAAEGKARWRRVAEREADRVTYGTVIGDRVYLLTKKDAPTFKVSRLDAAAGTAATAVTVVPAKPGRVLEMLAGAGDALYVGGLEGVYGKLLRVPHGGGAPEEVPLPVKGTIGQMWADSTRPGVVVLMAGWTAPPTHYRYDPATKRFTQLWSGQRPVVDAARVAVHDLRATAKDGVQVPFSVVAPAGPPRPRPLLINAYGSYGISQLPGFSPWRLALVDAGAAVATCHVRGGGELGEAWRLGGKDDRKFNTWRDLIACAEHAIAQGWTTKDQLVITGGSAGGIPMGRAMIERPELFAGVISQVPMASAIRAEFQQNGPVNTVEFGTIKEPTGFKNLLAMDHAEGGHGLSAGDVHHRPQRQPRRQLAAGQGGGADAGAALAQPGAAARRGRGRPRHRCDAQAG
jgi:prolyl oligopeptidase